VWLRLILTSTKASHCCGERGAVTNEGKVGLASKNLLGEEKKSALAGNRIRFLIVLFVVLQITFTDE